MSITDEPFQYRALSLYFLINRSNWLIKGISHITLNVRDLNKTSDMFTELFGAVEVYDSGDRYHSLSKEKFFLINGLWIAIMEGETVICRSYNHIAFKIEEKDYDKYLDRIRSIGLEILSGRDRVDSEGRSIYFYDYDNHLFELHTGSLEDRLNTYRKTDPSKQKQ